MLNIGGGAPPGTMGVFIESGGTANISGGTFTTAPQTISALTGSKLNLIGTAFLLNGAPIAGLVYGTALEVANRGATLSGTLADGSPVSFDLNATDPFPAQGDFIDPGARLTIRLVIPGDFNLDGIVDAADYTVWRDNLGQQGLQPFTRGDGNGDGLVTSADYIVWQNHFGAHLGTGASATVTVPEPTTVWMLLIATATMIGSSAKRWQELRTCPRQPRPVARSLDATWEAGVRQSCFERGVVTTAAFKLRKIGPASGDCRGEFSLM